MQGFERVLHSFRLGILSREQLLSEVDRRLSDPAVDPSTLLATLHQEHSRLRLPTDVHGSVARRIEQKMGDGADAAISLTRAETLLDPEVMDESRTAVLELTELIDDGDSARPASAHKRELGVSPGTVLLGRFELVEHVGEGGMSTVYRALDLRKVEARSTDPYIAVKLLTLPFSDYSASLAVLQREAIKLQSLAHPNIVRVIDCDRDGDIVFMTMEYLEGEALTNKYRDGGLPADEAVAALECIASALSFAHRQGIVHGDLKPGNVLVTAGGEVKVIDFGIARLMAQSSKGGSSGHGDHWGELRALTPAYASPEMLERKEPDTRDDIFALGCIAYELLTGDHPFALRPATQARDAKRTLPRHKALSRRQYKALSGALQFDREARTPSVERFMEQFRGSPLRRDFGWTPAIAAVLLALVVGAYWLDRSRTTRPTATPAVPSTPSLATGQMFRDCPTCPLMRVLPAGRFEQGSLSTEGEAAAFERPRHPVAIVSRLGMSIHEVTVGEFREFVEAAHREITGCEVYDGTWQERADLSWSNVGYEQTASHPVVCVSWQDAAAYAQWLSQTAGQVYRLPSASEWEYAARAGSQSSGDAPAACTTSNVADATAAQRYPGWKALACNDGYVYSAPVGSFAANAFGLQDMLGNVFEWVQDCWYDDYSGAHVDGSARIAPGCRERELRGGSWFTTPAYVRAGYRNRFDENHRSNSVGFRVVRDIRP